MHPTVCCPQEAGLRCGESKSLKVRGWKRHVVETDRRRIGVAMPTPDTTDFKIRTVTGDREGQKIQPVRKT